MTDLKILVVADEAEAEAVHHSFDRVGLQFQTAYSVDEALKKGQACQPDAYFLDESFYRAGSLHLQRLRQVSKRAMLYVMAVDGTQFAQKVNQEEAGAAIMGLDKPLDLKQVQGELEALRKLKEFRKEDTSAEQNTLNVLVVEESASVAKFVERAIARRWEKAEFIVKHDGYHGLQTMKHPPKKLDLVVCDLDLPGLRGEEMLLLAGAEGRLKDTPVLVLSNRVTPDVRKDFSEYNVAFLRKPAVPDQILAGMQMVLATARASGLSAA